MIKDFVPRLYQQTIFNSAVNRNCLVVLPTGLGKTAIALMLAVHRLKNYPMSKILILAPTKPLAEQHIETFKKHLEMDEDKIVLFTGYVKPDKRVELWKEAKVVVTTPQGLENDIISNKIPLQDVSLLVIDEAHRAVKDYAYVFVTKQYNLKAKYPRILGLTASPGSDIATIEEICQNLFIEEIEIRTEEDVDVKQYVQEVNLKWFEVDFPKEFKEIQGSLEKCIDKKLSEVKKLGYLPGDISNHTRKSILDLQAELRGRISSGEKDFNILRTISLLAEVMKVQHGLELLETQTLESMEQYFEKLRVQAETTSVKAVKNLMVDENFKSAKKKLNALIVQNVTHPKLGVLKEIIINEIGKNKKIKIIIFTQYRSSASTIKNLLDSLSMKNKVFIGQNKAEEKGLTQKEQKKIIEEFSKGEFNCLISTSVGEEGLDIPQVDLVIFYEPIPSAIRSIQRRGRTGRLSKGEVYVLMTKKTRDEAYRWAAHRKEKQMYRNLEMLKKSYNKAVLNPDKNLSSFMPKSPMSTGIKVLVDYREKGSNVMKTLIDEGVDVELKSLDIGDYLISDEVVIEYKTKKDFVDSIIDGRLLEQLKELTKYFKPIILVEGEEDIYSQRNVHPNSIRGMISTIAVSYRIPMIFSKNYQDSAEIIKIIAKREQGMEKRDFQMHSNKPMSIKEQQEYIISSLPGIGAALARPLLKKFKSVKKIMNAKTNSLKKIELIGDKKAKKIRDVIDSEYTSD